MNLNDALKGMQNPQNFYQQASASAYYIIYTSREGKVGDAYYEALGSLPERAKAAALDLFMNGEADSYHAKVIRAALKHYETSSFLTDDIPAKTVDELNG
jgi:hypothetical protein